VPLRLLCLLLLFVLTACGPAGDPSVAATVNGVDIPVEQVEERVEALRSNPQVAQQLSDDPEGQNLAQAQVEVLNNLIQATLLERGAAEEFGIEVGQAEIDEQRAQLIEEVGGEAAFDQLVQQNGLSEEQVQFELRRVALIDAVTAALADESEVTDDQVEAFYEENRETRFGASARARHILVDDQATAQQAIDRLAAGEDFAAVATELSTDTGSAAQGGELGELSRGQTVEAFDEAVFSSPIGKVIGPIQTEFGFHVLEVLERRDEPEPLNDVEDEIRDELSQAATQEEFNAFLREQAEQAEVTVNPRIGVWDETLATVTRSDALGDAESPLPSAEPTATSTE
jgi:foldase protein PrsA